jgi:hypothetical protein
MTFPSDSTKPHVTRDLLPRALRGSDLPLPPWDGWLQYDSMEVVPLPSASAWMQVDRPEQSENPPPPEGLRTPAPRRYGYGCGDAEYDAYADRVAQILQRVPDPTMLQTMRGVMQSPPPDALRTPAEAAAKLGCSIKQPQKHKAKTPKRVPSPDTITPTTPLRLDIAAQIAFPDGSIGVSGLRREIERGNLRVEQIAGKTFTTLANIEDMRKKCAIPTKGRESSSENHGGRENPTDGSSSTAMPADVASSARQAHLRQVAQGLRNSGRTPKKPSPTTSDESTSRNSAAVIRLKSE